MRVAIVSTWEATCGIASYTKALARALYAIGVEVTILAETFGETYEDFSLENQQLEDTSSEVGIKVYRIWRRRRSCVNTIGKFLQHNKFDLVHFQHEFAFFTQTKDFLDLLKNLDKQNQRFLVTLHTVAPPPKQEAFFYGFEFQYCPLAVTNLVASAIVRVRTGRDPYLLPMGMYERTNIPNLNTQTFITGACPGFLRPTKGHEELIQGFAKAYEYNKKNRLIIIGKPDDSQYVTYLQDMIGDYGLEDHILLQPTYAEDDLYDKIYRSAHYILLGAMDETPYATSMQLYTAFGYGLPVVAKNVPLYRHEGGVLLFDTPEECGLHIRAMEDDLLRGILSEKSKEVTLKHDWRRIAEKHLAVYRELA